MAEAVDSARFERILEYLRQTRGVDFTAYKRASVVRRVLRRMQAVNAGDFDAYLDYLEVHPDEFAALFNTILINVTSFFRDPDVWDAMRTDVLPAIVEANGLIRVWSAGAASGQEPYSAAMLLAELLGPEAFRERVKIYATDADEEALGEARRAVYSARHVADVPPELRDKYFDRLKDDGYSVNRDVRRSVIFGRHDLIEDAPISRVDLLLCRNTLMYFNAEAQTRLMARFFFSLNSGGFLLLGRAEMLFSHAAMFQPADLKRRIFKAVPRVPHRDRLLLAAQSGREEIVPTPPNHARLRDAAFDAISDAHLVVDPAGALVGANAAARRQFGVSASDFGSLLQSLEVSYRPVDLRSAMDRVRTERREVVIRGAAWERAGATGLMDVTIAPLFDDQRALMGIRVSFADVSTLAALRDELTHSKQALEAAYEELQSTNEELETTNEELQSTVEELETTNEELQSTNEELETMNEELQSTNEELQTMNDELRNRSTDLNENNAFLESVFASLRSAVVVLDRDLRVHIWNAGALDLWGLRADETRGTSFFALDIGLPVADLHLPIREILSGSAPHREAAVTATDRRGRTIQCCVSVAPLIGLDRGITGVILLMDAEPSATAGKPS